MAQAPRISQTAFEASQFTFLVLAILAAAIKVGLRLKQTKSLSIDDGLLIIGTILLAASVTVFYHSLDIVYYIFDRENPYNPQQMIQFSKLVCASAVLSWSTIYIVKISFILFFRPLVNRLPLMRLYWWVVFVLVLACAPVASFMTFYICGNFTTGIMSCGRGIEFRASVYLHLTAALDMFTDLLLMSVPVALLWRVQINLRRKLALAAVLCLSTFMVIIQILRISLAYVPVSNERDATLQDNPFKAGQPIPSRQLDQTWMFFWLNIEATVAIIMVALTAFRSALGRQQASKYTPPYVKPSREGRSNKEDADVGRARDIEKLAGSYSEGSTLSGITICTEITLAESGSLESQQQ